MCTLRAYGKKFDVDGFLARSLWKTATVFHRGDRRGKNTSVNSGFNLGVSDASWSDLSAQLRHATAFIRKNEKSLRRLNRYPGIEKIVLDFPVETKLGREGVWSQEEHFPSSFVALAASIGLAIALSIYPVDDTH